MNKNCLALIPILFCTPAKAQGPVPISGDFQVNSYTIDTQYRPSLATLTDGSFVVVWHSYGSGGSDSSATSIQGQRYAPGGTLRGEEYQVNSYSTHHQRDAAAAALAGGGFVVVWSSDGSNGSDSSRASIQGRRYAADGTALGEEFQVNSYTTDDQIVPSVAGLADGGYVALWFSYGSSGTDSSGSSIQGQRYAADGTQLEEQFQVNSYTASNQWFPAVTGLADGGYVALWESFGSNGTDTSGNSIQGQRYAAPRFALVGLAEKCLDVEGVDPDPADGTPVLTAGWRVDRRHAMLA